MEDKILYADYEPHSKTNDMFVVTPSGNYFNFPGSDYDETHAEEKIIDPKDHKIYTVVFNV